MDDTRQLIRSALVGGELPCAQAFAIAQNVGVPPRRIGQMSDELGIRLGKCQLGLFGYGSKAEGKHRRVVPMQEVPTRVESELRAAVDADGKLTCSSAWELAARLQMTRQEISNAAEALGIRVKECQLGAF